MKIATVGLDIASTYSYYFALQYAPNSDVLSANDSVNGNWTYGYDDFNRLASANNSAQNLAYTDSYDRYGNKWNQDLNGACTAGTSYCLTFDANNQISAVAVSSTPHSSALNTDVLTCPQTLRSGSYDVLLAAELVFLHSRGPG
ncbi:MAG TPA: hypothetical protein VJQ50_07515 [Terriglobales bacterium]|nr:hypothetical protein [Terriglobales bacterium]